ncbi:TOMM system kinase/cyclase fusion protein [Sorangium sp. So ce362]|uniref:TOMM system kinase/cyclase fusion protein n=1 Tax=Sorangium sp. So ce362 TaxID=3133303 RepID=UPI003F62CD8C
MHQANSLLAGGAAFADRYELLSEIGMGGFGAVYKARQLTTGQAVALKIMRPPEQDGAAQIERRIARFIRETQLCAQLHHPNIVPLVDAGRVGEQLLYTVFSFVPGETLADVLAREGALAPREARHLMLQVLDALACAHAQGIIHRDLKPRNIMVLASGARRNAVVLDFGIGALVGAGAEQHIQLTGTNEALGTVGYAAPEQLRGLDPTPCVDLFSWGLVFLECLTGKPVFHGSSAADILYAQLSPEPVPIPRALDGHWLGGLLRHVTDKNAATRDAHAAALVPALEVVDLGDLSRETMVGSPPLPGSNHGGPRSVHALFEATIVARPGSTSRPTAEGERRQLTAVCCAIDVLADAPKALDVEQADELLRAQLGRCAEIAYRYRGHVAATLGDRLLIYFGYPRTEEDDAQRAARAALEIAAAAQAEGERLAARGVRLDARLGVHTGVLVAQERRAAAGLTVGATPRKAARIAALAPAGGVAVSVEAHRLLRSAFEFDDEGPRRGDADGTPAEIFVLRSERGARSTPDAESREAPLFGREQEMAILLDRWRRTRAGAGQCTLITGEPGIGKSRLARALRARLASDPHTFLELRCAPDTQHSVLFPVVDMLGRALGLDQEASPERRSARLEALLSNHGFTLAEAMPLFMTLLSLPMAPPHAALDVSPQRLKELTLNAVLSLLFGMAEERPLMLVAEDLHWCDATTLELLTHLVHEAPSAPVSVLMTARPEFSPPFSTTGVQQLPLSRLERAHVEELVTALLRGKSLPSEVIDQVVTRTDGVPLFVEELTQMLVESGVLVERNDRYEMARPLAREEIPSTLRNLLMARLDRLDRAKKTAQLAAALGREFSVEVLSVVSPFEPAVLQEHLDHLVGTGLVLRQRRMKAPGWAFKHALVRDAAYESLPREMRREVHARIAGVLEAHYPQWVTDRPELLAHHYTEAELVEQAIPYWIRAGQKALQQSASLEPIQHFERALDLLATRPDTPARVAQELGLRLSLSVALIGAHGYAVPAVGAAYERARELCDALGDSRQNFSVIWGLSAFNCVRAQLDIALHLSVRALGIAEKESDPALLVPAHLLHGGNHLWRGELRTAEEHLGRGLSFYDAAEHSALAAVYSYDPGTASMAYLAMTLWFLGYPDQAIQMARAAVAQTKARGHAHSYAHSLFRALQVALLRGEGGAALEELPSLLAVAEDKGFPVWHAAGIFLRGRALCLEGQVDRGIEDMRAGFRRTLEAGAQIVYPEFAFGLAEALGGLGQHEEALEAVAEALDHVVRTEGRLYEAELYRLRGDLSLRADPTASGADRAEESLHKAVEIARHHHARSWELRAALSLARLWHHQGRGAAARRLLSDSYTWFAEGFDTSHLKSAKATLDELSGEPVHSIEKT